MVKIMVNDYTLTWTEQVIADGVSPDDDIAIPIGSADRICAEWDTNGATTDAPNFDFHIMASIDGTTYGDNIHKTLVNAVAKDVVGIDNFAAADFGPATIKAELDVNNDNLVATEYVTLRLKVYRIRR
jgi:hypothetical protein